MATHARTPQILFERGFTTVLDVQITNEPCRVSQTGEIAFTAQKVWILQVSWPKPAVRPEMQRH